jgi:DNA-binding NarL/FixJ family response regulator
MAIRVLHADRFQLFRKGVKDLIEKKLENFEVIGFSSTVEETKEAILRYYPNILIMEGALLHETDAFSHILSFSKEHSPRMKIIVLTMYTDSAAFRKAVELGADGYLYKFNSVEEVCECIKVVSDGGKYFVQPDSMNDEEMYKTETLKQANDSL